MAAGVCASHAPGTVAGAGLGFGCATTGRLAQRDRIGRTVRDGCKISRTIIAKCTAADVRCSGRPVSVVIRENTGRKHVTRTASITATVKIGRIARTTIGKLPGHGVRWTFQNRVTLVVKAIVDRIQTGNGMTVRRRHTGTDTEVVARMGCRCFKKGHHQCPTRCVLHAPPGSMVRGVVETTGTK